MTFCPSGWFGRAFQRTGLKLEPYQPLTPDILLDGTTPLDLRDFDIDGTLHPTPGHTQGSLSLTLANQHALVGDLLASGILLGGIIRTHRAKSPPFEDDPRQVAQQLQELLHTVVAVGNGHLGSHGGVLVAVPRRGIDGHLGAVIQIESGRAPEIEAVLAVDVYMRVAVDQVILAGFLVVDMHGVVVAGIDLVVVILEYHAPTFSVSAGIGRIVVDGAGPVAAAGQNTIDCAHHMLLNKSYEKTNK